MDYADKQALALRLVSKFGTTAVLSRPTEASVQVKTTAVFLNRRTGEAAPASATAVKTERVLVPGSIRTPPVVGDRLSVKNKVYRVEAFTLCAPGGLPIYYELEVSSA